ncbi:MAG: putative ThiS family protein [Dehalococcoidales bacterium]|nr:putative ThiS family protein [Dehalococcoidales bacterium]
MGVKINIASYLQPFTNSTAVIEVKANTVGEGISQLVKQFPDIGKMLLDMNGKLHSYVGIYVNSEDAYPESLAKPVKDGDELHILYIISGG